MENLKVCIDGKSRMVMDVVEDLECYKRGLFVTLNSITKDEFKFDGQLDNLIHWLRDYCYGRSYSVDKSRLRVVGAFEVGTFNQGLHAHLVIMHSSDTNRTADQIEAFIRRKWYVLTGGNDKAHEHGSLVNVQNVGTLEGGIKYLTKTYYHQSNQFNLRYF